MQFWSLLMHVVVPGTLGTTSAASYSEFTNLAIGFHIIGTHTLAREILGTTPSVD